MIKKIIFISLLIFSINQSAFAKTSKVLDVQKFKTLNNVEVWLVEDHSVPIISLNFSFNGGLALEPANKSGTAKLVSILLDEGAGKLRSQDFQSELDNNSINMGFTAGRDFFYGELKTLSENKDKAFKLLSLALTTPHFDKDAIKRMKNSNIAEIKNSLGNPAWLVARTFNGMAFKGNSYALPGAGNLESMKLITRNDLIKFTKNQFAQNLLKISIAGDISKVQAIKAVNEIFEKLPKKVKLKETKEAILKYSGKVILLKINTPQTFISLGEQGIKRSDPDWNAAVVMNYILGGGSFDSRLMNEIREKRGLTYGIYSSLSSMKDAALIQASLSTSNKKAFEALKLLKIEWQKMAEHGATKQELKDAKDYITGSLLLALTSTDAISSTLNSLQRHRLDYNYINNRNDKINAITLKDISRVAKKLLKAENLITIMVGKPENIKADITLKSPPNMAIKK